MQIEDNRPLVGVTVVDFSQQIAGPAVAMTLADFGATVVRIDPPDGPTWQHDANHVLQRNKHCLRLDLKTEQGLAQALVLIDKADIVLESFRPGVMKRLGIDFEHIRAERPELISISIPGFASNDLLRSQWKATESVVAAASGAFTDMGYNRVLMGLNPSFSPLPLASSYATSLAASAAVFALFHREKTGLGDHIEVPISAALMEGLSYNSCLIDNLPDRYVTMREQEIKSRRENGRPLDVSYEDLQNYLDPFYRTYECSDGRFFYCVCPSHRNHAKRALQVLGLYDDLIKMGLPEVEDVHKPISQWNGETSIGVYPLPKKWANIISEMMKRAFLTKTSTQWGRIFGLEKIPGSPHRTTQQWIHSEHSKVSGLSVEVATAELGTMLQPGPIAWLDECADAMLTPKEAVDVTFTEALLLLEEIGIAHTSNRPKANADTAAPNSGLWLEGVKVLDLTNVIAGPHSCAFLTRFGAQVTKLDPVKPLYDPMIGIIYSFQTDLGKRKILADINTEQGREIFNALIRSVDIVVINAPHRQLKSLGLDQETLQSVNPGVLFCRLDCLGGPRVGPKSDYIGYDDIIQSNSGIMLRFGGEQTPEEHAHIGTLDVNCGFAAGMAMGLSLYHKLRTGEVTTARTSLAAVTNLAQIPFAFDYPNRKDFNEPSGRGSLGYDAFSHFYQCLQGWLYIDSTEQEIDKIAKVSGLKGIEHCENVGEYLTQMFKCRSASVWEQSLQAVGIAAAQTQSIAQLRDKYSRISDGEVGIDSGSYAFSIDPQHPSGHCFTRVDHYAIRPVQGRIIAVAASEKFGHSSKEVLEEIGYTYDQIDNLIKENIVATGWSDEYLPS
jgi:crotonobetainyl-CoA:carnitine CoA-transferase CaiB-like acyl-CoA transferase